MANTAADFDTELLVELTEADGVPGYEDAVREIVRREFADTVDEVRSDAMGNVIGTIEGASEYDVVVAAHMDEIGFMVTHVTDEGFVALDALGGWDPRVLKAQRVRIHTEAGPVAGVIGSPPPHTMDEEERTSTPEVKDLYVDLGLPADVATDRVAPGDFVTIAQTTETVGDRITGKALDDRVSVFAMLEAARRIDDPAVTIHFAATVQEEVGLRGARALGVDLDPDLAIAVDVTVANDVPGFEEKEYVTTLGEGTAIKLKDSSVITNPKVHRRMREVATSEEIPYQIEVLPAGGTDTAGFQTPAGAKPVGAISIPTRYLHTATEMVDAGDVAATIDLLTAYLESESGAHDYTL